MSDVRLATPADLEHLVALESHAIGVLWSRAQLADELENPRARVWTLRLSNEMMVAFAVVWLVADELQIQNVITHADHRRRGHARALLASAIADARGHGATSATLEVRVSNQGARALYRGLGFVETGGRPRYYQDPIEDAVLMTLRL